MLTVRDPAAWASSYQELHAFDMGLWSKEAMRTEPYMKWHAIVDALIWGPMHP